jgi:integrase/recombinase XerD
MTSLTEGVRDYLSIRRGLGAKLDKTAGVLKRFVAFLHSKRSSFITSQLALEWAMQPVHAQPTTWAQRLGILRGFAEWRSTSDPRTQVPSAGLLPHRYRRTPPYIYSEAEVLALVEAAAALPTERGLRACSYATLFGLIAACGLRLGEALALDDSDVDLVKGVLEIRRGKFGKSRLIPVHETTRHALVEYVRLRDRLRVRRSVCAFFIGDQGNRITQCTARYTFAKISRAVGLRPATTGGRGGPGRHGRGPRIHDLRHRFAARRLISWYRAGVQVDRRLRVLATYLGHTHVADTYWYLEAVPELLHLVSERVQRQFKEVTSP